jgi:hypothetical protein
MPAARQSVPKHMTLARDPPVAIRCFSLFLGEISLADFSISIGIHSLPPETAWSDSQPFFDNFSLIPPEQRPYRSLNEGIQSSAITGYVHFAELRIVPLPRAIYGIVV